MPVILRWFPNRRRRRLHHRSQLSGLGQSSHQHMMERRQEHFDRPVS